MTTVHIHLLIVLSRRERKKKPKKSGHVWSFQLKDTKGRIKMDKPLFVEQCIGFIPGIGQCGRKIARLQPFCNECYPNYYYVQVRKSTIPGAGFGLFCNEAGVKEGDVVFKEGNFIAPYFGEILTKKQFDKRYEGSVSCVYTMMEDEVYYDSCLYRGATAYSNDSSISGIEPNAYFDKFEDIIGIVASRDIVQGEELFTTYGDDYWTSQKSEYKTYKAKI